MEAETGALHMSLAAGALVAIELVLRDRLADALADDHRAETVTVPVVAMMVLAEFAESCHEQIKRLSPASEGFINDVCEIVHLYDLPNERRSLTEDVGAGLRDRFGDTADPMVRWFACELVRLLACAMPLPPGTADSRARLDYSFGKR